VRIDPHMMQPFLLLATVVSQIDESLRSSGLLIDLDEWFAFAVIFIPRPNCCRVFP
jgi:hypothetical protein